MLVEDGEEVGGHLRYWVLRPGSGPAWRFVRDGGRAARLGAALVAGRLKKVPARALRETATRQRLSRLVGFAQCAQVGCEVVGRGEGVGMVVTQRPAASGEGVLVECAGLLIVAQRA
jgi:hypothetical protein